MKQSTAIKKYLPNETHGFVKGQHAVLDGKRVVITRTTFSTVWYRPESWLERARRLWNEMVARKATAPAKRRVRAKAQIQQGSEPSETQSA